MRVSRLCFSILIVMMVIDACPKSYTQPFRPVHWLMLLLYQIGLHQGDWSMFAPDPRTINERFSLRLPNRNGDEKVVWESPDWKKYSIARHFVLSRERNYFSNIGRSNDILAQRDLVDWILRKQQFQPDRPANLICHEMKLLLHEPGDFPSKDAVVRIFSDRVLIQRNRGRRVDEP